MLKILPTLLFALFIVAVTVLLGFSEKKKRIAFLSDCVKGVSFESLVNKYGIAYAMDNYPKYVLTIIGGQSKILSADINAERN